mgnify:CR=1 FL=1
MTNAVIPLIRQAKKYIYIPTFVLTEKRVTEELILAKRRGVDVKIIIDASQGARIIDETEGEIIQNAINFSEICAHEIMMPRQDMKCLYSHYSFEEALDFIKKHKRNKYC